MQVLHELHPVCKGNGNQDVLLLYIWLINIVGETQSKLPHSVESGIRNEQAACAACHVLMALLLSKPLS